VSRASAVAHRVLLVLAMVGVSARVRVTSMRRGGEVGARLQGHADRRHLARRPSSRDIGEIRGDVT